MSECIPSLPALYTRVLILQSDIRAYSNYGADYHSDHSFEINPPAYTMLRLVRTPESGGDTIFTSQTALYDKLSPSFQQLFDSLHAVHSSEVSCIRRCIVVMVLMVPAGWVLELGK